MEQSDVTKSHKVFSVRIPVEVYAALEAVALEEHRNRQSIIVSAINLYLERRRVAAEGAAKFVAEFDRAKAHEMTVDRTLQAAAATQAPPAGLPAVPKISDEAARAGQITPRPGSPGEKSSEEDK